MWVQSYIKFKVKRLVFSLLVDVADILIIQKSFETSRHFLTDEEASLAKATSSAPTDKTVQPQQFPANDEHSFDLITSQFVGRFNNTSPILLDTFYGRNTTFKQNANLFPDKLSNLKQRVVRLALFNYIPYTVWEEVVSAL